MILAFDTYYFEDKAKTVCISFNSWAEEKSVGVYSEIVDKVEDYTPGEFYKRELPCILSLIKRIDCSKVEAIIIDGFVFLDDHQKLGLGGYLYKELYSKIPVIGVAKTSFSTIKKLRNDLYRGDSKRPLYITSIGISIEDAAKCIKNMSGAYRIPTLLKELDRLTKEK